MPEIKNNIEKYDEAVNELIELATVCKAGKSAEDHADAIALASQAERMAYRLWGTFCELKPEPDNAPPPLSGYEITARSFPSRVPS